MNGYDVHCVLGIGLEELQHQVEKTDLKTECPDITVILAGTNNKSHRISATEIMVDTMDLVDYIRKQAPKTKIVISRVLYR